MKITKAVITAAGRGTRFLPVVKGYAKELVPIMEKPQIQYLIEEAIGAGITEICIVHRHGEKTLKNYFKDSIDWDKYLQKINKPNCLDSIKEIHKKLKTFKFIPQPQHLPYGTGSPVLSAKSFINNEPFVLMYGDDLIIEKKQGQFLGKMVENYEKYNPSGVLCVKDVGRDEIYRYGSMKYINDLNCPNRISEIVEKLPEDLAPSTMALGGRFVVDGKKIIPLLQKQGLSRDNELWFTDAINALAINDVVMTVAVGSDADWMTTGDPLRWLQANNAMALNNPKYREEMERYLKNICE